MDVHAINYIYTVGLPVGKALPRSQNINRRRELCKQKFVALNNRNLRQLSSAVASTVNRTVISAASRMRGNENRQNIPTPLLEEEIISVPDIVETFECGVEIEAPDFVRLFSKNDIDLNSQKELLEIPLGGEIDLNLVRTKNRPDALLIEQAIRENKIILDLKSTVQLWKLKMLNPRHKHFPKFVLGFSVINLLKHVTGRTRIEDEKVVLNLTPQMEKVRQLYQLMFSGIALLVLFTQKPTKFLKKEYNVQRKLRHMVPRTGVIKNDASYSLIFDQEVQFTDNKGTKTHSFIFCIVFQVFRIRILDDNQTWDRTLIILDSAYPRGNIGKITCPLWENDMDLSNIDPEIDSQADKDKFQWLKEYVKDSSFLGALKSIYPEFEQDTQLKKKIKESLQSSGFDERVLDEILRGEINWPNP